MLIMGMLITMSTKATQFSDLTKFIITQKRLTQYDNRDCNGTHIHTYTNIHSRNRIYQMVKVVTIAAQMKKRTRRSTMPSEIIKT